MDIDLQKYPRRCVENNLSIGRPSEYDEWMEAVFTEPRGRLQLKLDKITDSQAERIINNRFWGHTEYHKLKEELLPLTVSYFDHRGARNSRKMMKVFDRYMVSELAVQHFIREWRNHFLDADIYYHIAWSKNSFRALGETCECGDSCFRVGGQCGGHPIMLYYTRPSFTIYISTASDPDIVVGRCWGILDKDRIFITNFYYGGGIDENDMMFYQILNQASGTTWLYEKAVDTQFSTKIAGVYNNGDGLFLHLDSNRDRDFLFSVGKCRSCNCYSTYALCDSCAEGLNEEGISCYECGNFVDDDYVYYNRNGEGYCEHCYHRFYYSCARCNDELWHEDALFAQNDYWCESCYSDRFATCDDCGEGTPLDDINYLEHSDTGYCEDCFHRHAIVCDNCDCAVEKEDAIEILGSGFCESCGEDVLDSEEYRVYRQFGIPFYRKGHRWLAGTFFVRKPTSEDIGEEEE